MNYFRDVFIPIALVFCVWYAVQQVIGNQQKEVKQVEQPVPTQVEEKLTFEQAAKDTFYYEKI